ncbi:MAG: U32 family peptidase [Bacteroidales bacterium]|nr:U32 family peptidase [Bacteroidales bacterium]
MKRSDIEIMSPAGSYESLQAAIQGGAASVYFGVEQLNMRSKSSFNFTLDDLEAIVGICRKHGIRSYLTVNTVLYDNELDDMRRIVDAASEHGITAIIATDLAAIQYARSIGMEVHISTQLNVTNLESLRFFAAYADVMVLARELNLSQVKEIAEAIRKERITGPSGKPVQLELFVHGALCMAISGKCYLSLHEKNHSANRGKCLQTCRKSYIVTEKQSGNELEVDHEYIMSPKDLSTIHFLNKILDAGVTVLKIEGRARSPEYVKTTTECYREAVDAWFDGTYSGEKIKDWQRRLATVFNRGFWNGYYLGQRLGEWSHRYGSQATRRKIFVGQITNYYKRIQVAELLAEANTIDVNDEILILGPTTGLIQTHVREIRVGDQSVQTSPRGIKCSLPVEQTVRRSDKLYKLVDATRVSQQ